MTEDTTYLIPRQDESERELPANIELEQALLGAIFINNEAFYRVCDFLEPQHFFEPLHGRIYLTCMNLIYGGAAATASTVRTYFENDEAMKSLGGGQYLARLAMAAVTVLHAADYGRTLYKLAMCRHLISSSEEILDMCWNPKPETGIKDIVSEFYGALAAVEEPRGRAEAKFADVLQEAFSDVEAMQKGERFQVPIGLAALNTALSGGLGETDLVLLGARPGMGKTALALLIMLTCAKHRGPVLFHSLEMSRSQLGQRLFGMQADVNTEKLRRKGSLDQADWERITAMMERLNDLNITIDHSGDRTIESLRAQARVHKRIHDTKLVVIDHLGLLRPTNRTDNRVNQITHITGQAKQMAKELGCTVLLLSQLNREVEKRDDKRPQLSDLRDSGSIEQDADQILLLYRDGYYLKKEGQGAKNYIERMADAHIAEVSIAKNRHGPEKRVEVRFDDQFTRFADLEGEYTSEDERLL